MDLISIMQSWLPSTGVEYQWDWAYTMKMFPVLLQASVITIELAIKAIIFGSCIGLVVALMKISKIKVLNYLGSVYTWVFRGIPLLVQLFIIYFGIAMAFQIYMEPMFAATLGISLCGGAYIAEIIRAGIQSVDKGQMEAAISLGMNKWQAMFRIILPQTYRRLIPPMGNEFITLLKDTALASTITVTELLRTAQLYSGSSFKPFELYISAAVIYLLMTTFFTMTLGALESKLSRAD